MRHGGYILRVKPEWVDTVFQSGVYYTGFVAVKGWRPGSTVIFVSKTEVGDSIIGYGVIERVRVKEELSEGELAFCIPRGWSMAVEFSSLTRLSTPVPVKITPIAKWGVYGRYLHGRRLTAEELEAIMRIIG